MPKPDQVLEKLTELYTKGNLDIGPAFTHSEIAYFQGTTYQPPPKRTDGMLSDAS